jgi:small subunit ribosomal protein S6
MEARKHTYETVFVLHPELAEEEVEADIQNIVGVLENGGSEVLRVDRGGKRRLAYVVQKQRYGYYNLIHFRAAPEALPPLERTYRLSERVIRYLTLRFEKEEQLTGFTRISEDESRDDDRGERRRGGRRGEFFRPRAEDRGTQASRESGVATESETTEESTAAPSAESEVAAVLEPSEKATEQSSEEIG